MALSPDLDVRITDSCLRDGSHAKRHQFTEAEVRAIVTALDGAGVPVIEVSHGDGLAGSSFTYGFSGTDERQLVAAAVESAARAKIAVLMLPGVAGKDDITAARDLRAPICPIATPCTQAHISVPHFQTAPGPGPGTGGFLL